MESINKKIRICCISDTHNEHRKIDFDGPCGFLEEGEQGDILIHAGDFCSHGSEKEVEDFADWFGKVPFKHKIVIPGNHDKCLDETMYNKYKDCGLPQELKHPEPIKQYIRNCGENVHYLDH